MGKSSSLTGTAASPIKLDAGGFEQGEYLCIIQFDAFVDLLLLDGRGDQPQGCEARLVLCPHGILNILQYAVLE